MQLDPNRSRGLLVMRGLRVTDVARRLNKSDSYVSQQIAGMRPMTSDLLAVLRELLGAEAMAWASGQTDTLHLPSTPPTAA